MRPLGIAKLRDRGNSKLKAGHSPPLYLTLILFWENVSFFRDTTLPFVSCRAENRLPLQFTGPPGLSFRALLTSTRISSKSMADKLFLLAMSGLAITKIGSFEVYVFEKKWQKC
jgi:hypothetical protein